MVRARVRDDLERLNEFIGGVDGEIYHLPGHDYPYRVLYEHGEWIEVVSRLVADVDYSNFKNAVTANARTLEEGHARHDLYMRVWSIMSGAENWLRAAVERLRNPVKAPKGEQGSLGFYEPSGRFVDPRSDDDMAQIYRSEEWYRGRRGRRRK